MLCHDSSEIKLFESVLMRLYFCARSYRFILGLCCFFGATASVFGGGFLLEAPPPFEVNESELKSHSLDMTWEGVHEATGSKRNLRFRYFQGKTYLLVQFQGQLPKELTPVEIQKLQKGKQQGGEVWSFVHPTPPQSIYQDLTRIEGTLEEEMGRLAQPLVVEGGKPSIMYVKQLSEQIAPKRVVFYTGAGISAGVVPTMGQLMAGLKVGKDRGTIFTQTLKMALQQPKPLVAFMEKFNQNCLRGSPTKAHWAIKKLAIGKGWGLMTENIDHLHQRTGIKPLSHEQDWLKDNVSVEDLQKIDAIITVGLRSDESGFLGWYKQHNPAGTIIAVDLAQPIYLSNQDYFIEGNLQAVLPQLQQLVLAES